MTEKVCFRCEKLKPISEFRHAVGRKNPEGTCKQCYLEADRKRKQENPEHFREISRRCYKKKREASGFQYPAPPRTKKNLSLKFYNVSRRGMSLEEYEARLSDQKNLCLVCHRPPTGKSVHNSVLHIDHDHETGVVRGLLCGGCNKGLGYFRENPESLKRAAEYVSGGFDLRFKAA